MQNPLKRALAQEIKSSGRHLAGNTYMSKFVWVALSVASVQSAYAAQVNLVDVIPVALDRGQTELRLKFDAAPPAPQAYQIEKPARLVLDLPETHSLVDHRYQNIDQGRTRNLTVLDNNKLTRLVINLTEQGGYTTRVEGHTLVLKIGAPGLIPAAQPSAALRSQRGNVQVNRVDFKRAANNEGQVIVSLGDANIPVDVQQQGNRLIARFASTKIAQSMVRRLNVGDSGTMIKTVDAYNEGNTGVVVIEPNGPFEFQSYQTDRKLIISVKPPAREEQKKAEQITYTGQKLSLNFQDIEVRSVLQLIADFTGFNLVASDTVNGRITIRLQNVPWDQALDIILRTKGLDKRRNGNVILIAPADELAAREKQEAEGKKQLEQLEQLRTEYIRLSYAKVADIETLITSGRNTTSISSNNTDATVGSLLSPRGTVSKDVRTNTLIIHDVTRKIDEIRSLIEKLDVPVRQVMIEARIVRATDSFSKELGVKWGVLSKGIANNRNLLVGGSTTTLMDLRNPAAASYGSGAKYTITTPQNLSVDMGATGTGASRIAFGLLSMSNLMLDLELSALQADGKGEVVATPKVLTTDKQKARIAAGTQIPYQAATSSGATSVQFINAELSLEVTPSITPDGRIGMELFVNSDTPGEIQPTGIRAIDTNRVSTNVLINDGQTVVLGGIFQNQITNSVTKTPFLGDLPYVGRLFQHNVKSNDKQELLIFVTPRLVSEKGTSGTP